LVIVNGLSDRISSYIGSPTARLSTVDGSAFAWISEKNLAPYLGHKVVFTDSAGKKATGYIKEADAGEGLGAELYTVVFDDVAHPFETFTLNVLDISQAINSVAYGICYTAVINGTVGKLYKTAFDYTLNSGFDPTYRLAGDGTLSIGGLDRNTALSGTDSYTFYTTRTTGADFRTGFRVETGVITDFAISNFSLKEVTHVGADGVHIVSAKDGTVHNWASIDSGFDPNNIDFANVYDK